MNNLALNITIDSLSFLTPVSPNTYELRVRFYTMSGVLLSSEYIPNNYLATVNTTTNNFVINIPVSDVSFNYGNVVIKVFANNASNCCFAEGTFVLENTGSAPSEMEARLISRGWFEHLDTSQEREGSGYRIVDLTDYPLDPSGQYEWSYFLNEKWIKMGSSTLNIFWPSTVPLNIYKVQSKIGLDSLNRWSDDDPDGPGGYYDPNSCKPFSNNCSVAYTSLCFND